MKVKELVRDQYAILACLDGEECEVDTFLANELNDPAIDGFQVWFQHVAENGLNGIPNSVFHEADKRRGVFEFIKGDWRIMCFKGDGRNAAVCVTAVRKKGQKADSKAVKKTAALREAYFEAVDNGNLEVMKL